MRIEICAKWDRMSMQEVAAQFAAQFNGVGGEVGYLSEPYYGEPYPTYVLAPEAFRYGRARITAANLEKRLPDALHLVETREECFGFSPDERSALKRIQQQYREFVALCARKEQECGIPCMIVASH